ncbi:hypothetical protein [Fructilactobacillus frigidiflavus]|uniref:hypothetical protein n=1 Tax=Fructilactobacillus frigidiflavus TaxID=3242688 RepID=UPI0037567999
MNKTIEVPKTIKNLIGNKYHRLTVVGLSDKKVGRKRFWLCKCDCGNEIVVRSDSLKGGHVKSCGCLKIEQDNFNLDRTIHGDAKRNHITRLFHIWQGMKKRCYDKNDKRYSNYGGRGIFVCDEWLNSFEVFKEWSISNGYKDNLTIERIDVDKPYMPSNCTWITVKEQANNRTTSVWVTYNGQTLTLKDWSEKTGINYGTLNSRYNRDGKRPPKLFEPVKR